MPFNVRQIASVALVVCAASCTSPKQVFTGHWVCEQTPVISLDLYPDGTATFSGLNLLSLKWQVVSSEWVRIDALDNSVTINFRLKGNGGAQRATLQATGFDALTFVKKG